MPVDAWRGDDPLAMAEQRAARWKSRYERADAAYRAVYEELEETQKKLAEVERDLAHREKYDPKWAEAFRNIEARAEQAEAALARVRALFQCGPHSTHPDYAVMPEGCFHCRARLAVQAALDGDHD